MSSVAAAASSSSQIYSTGVGVDRQAFRVYILEDIPSCRKLALLGIQSTFNRGGFGDALKLVVDTSQNYEQFLNADLKKIQENFYRVVLADNDLSGLPDAVKFERNLTPGAKLIFKCATSAKVRPSTLFILNSSNNATLVHDFPKLREVFQLIPSAGKNSKEAFAAITELFKLAHKEATSKSGANLEILIIVQLIPSPNANQGILFTVQFIPSPDESREFLTIAQPTPSPNGIQELLSPIQLSPSPDGSQEFLSSIQLSPSPDENPELSTIAQPIPFPSLPLTIGDGILSPRDMHSPYTPTAMRSDGNEGVEEVRAALEKSMGFGGPGKTSQ